MRRFRNLNTPNPTSTLKPEPKKNESLVPPKDTLWMNLTTFHPFQPLNELYHTTKKIKFLVFWFVVYMNFYINTRLMHNCLVLFFYKTCCNERFPINWFSPCMSNSDNANCLFGNVMLKARVKVHMSFFRAYITLHSLHVFEINYKFAIDVDGGSCHWRFECTICGVR